MKVCITVDVEQDCPPYLETYSGIEQGMPVLFELFAETGVPATCFTTGDVARRYPDMVNELVRRGHELGCHGDSHRTFDTLTEAEARQELADATRTLREHAEVTSFRAPNLRFPDGYLSLLAAAGFTLDSSQARYKAPYPRMVTRTGGLLRVPASMTSSVLRLPRLLREAILSRLAPPVVLFVHPWEFVDFRKSDLRLDCRFRTGPMARQCLSDTIRFLQKRRGELVRMGDVSDSRKAR